NSVMSDPAQIRKLEEELDRLSAQIHEQQQTINRLKEALRRLNGNPGPAPVPSHTRPLLPHGSLENIIGLRLIHLVGMIVLVIGLSLGVKYAIDANLISEKMRILLAYLASGALLFFSFRLRKAYAGFSAILFSGAMASVYFTTYAAFVYYSLLSLPATFVLMVLFTFYTVFEAIRYDRQEIALLGLVGAYGIPFLISPNRGNPQLLFLYMTIINAGILALSMKKNWILMGRLAQAITWIIFIGWLVMQESMQLKGTGLLFMSLFFFLFLLNAVSPKLLRKEKLDAAHSYQLLLNNMALSLSALYVFGYSFENTTIAVIALFLSLFVAAQALLFHYWKEGQARTLLGSYALSLFVLFIGFQWSGIVVTLLWLLTAVVLFAVGVKLKSIALRMAAITLMGITLLKLLVLDSLTFSTIQKVIAYLVLGVLLLLVSFFYQKFREQLFGE
ncbi:MAG TPA: DUF2339 domain-containing protein, partial [Flavisolibacter sp.]|nr:DUF2339 domain-containing protein [Flavisolibacter sp.]